MAAEKIDIPQLLARLPLFQALTPAQFSQIASGAREKHLTKGEMAFQKGDPAKGFYIVASGQVKLAFPSPQGNEKVVDIVGPRQSFGEAVMFMDRPYPVYAEALTETLLIHIARQNVLNMLTSDPSFAMQMLDGLSMRLHALISDVESYSLRSSTQRVIGYLLEHCPEDASVRAHPEVTLPASKQVIASRLNLTPETLSRIFHHLNEIGLIKVHGKRIVINDISRLREFDH